MGVSNGVSSMPGSLNQREEGGSPLAAPCFAVDVLTGSTLHSGARPDTHQDPRTSAPGLPSRDYRMEHVETPLQACEHNWLPIAPGRAGIDVQVCFWNLGSLLEFQAAFLAVAPK